jgi:Tol biopolymer transport system component
MVRKEDLYLALKLCEIYLMKPEQSGVSRLTSNRFEDEDQYWSRDGSKIAFTS